MVAQGLGAGWDFGARVEKVQALSSAQRYCSTATENAEDGAPAQLFPPARRSYFVRGCRMLRNGASGFLAGNIVIQDKHIHFRVSAQVPQRW